MFRPTLIALFLAPTVAAPQATLEADRTTISVGESVRLRWSAPGASSVFLSGTGLVPPVGERSVEPPAGTTYVLSAETGAGLTTVQVRIAVTGARGGDDFPYPTDYGFPFTYPGELLPIPAFLDRVHDVLQNRLGHPVRTYSEADGTVAFETMTRRKDPDEDDTRGTRRRIAYRVSVLPATAAAYRFRIETVLETQLRLERIWRRDNDAGSRERHTRALAEQLSGAVTPRGEILP